MTTANTVLTDALGKRIADYESVCRDMREMLECSDDDVAAMREAIELVRVLRRLVALRSVKEVHAAFGAPGDFGYETVIGDALARLYGVR